MEKKTMDTLRGMICGEIEDIAKKGALSHENLDILKDLVETEKNLAKIEKYEDEKKQKEMGMELDRGYSQRKYYIDADYQPPYGMNSYRGGYSMDNSYGRGNSYARGNSYGGGQMYVMDGGNSYMYYDPRYEQMYSRHGNKQEMVMELQNLMNEAPDEKTKEALQKTIMEVNK